ncbi:MAG: hypothetical protein P9L91_08830 [Candidatus Zophobacter franzmannii]|nr:hypothetical protein [Candidatus Zophobacter franzmannii]
MFKKVVLICLLVYSVLYAIDSNGVFTVDDFGTNSRAAMLFSQRTSDPVSLGLGSTDVMNSKYASSMFANPANMAYASHLKFNETLDNNKMNADSDDGFGLRFGIEFPSYYPTRFGFRYGKERFYDNDIITNVPKISSAPNSVYAFSLGTSIPFDIMSSFDIRFEYSWVQWEDYQAVGATLEKSESVMPDFVILVGLNLGI